MSETFLDSKKMDEFFEALRLLEKENGIKPDQMIEKVKQGIVKAVKREYPDSENIYCAIDPENNTFRVALIKTVVEGEPENGDEITLDRARAIDKNARVGGTIEIEVSSKKFGRGAAGTAKQSIRGDIREFEKERLTREFKDKVHECISATVTKIDPTSGIVTLEFEKHEVYLFKNEQIPGEVLREGDFVKVYVVEILSPEKRPALKISRTHKDLVKRLFELEVPEIYDGTVEIKAISREAGSRTKIAVCSKDENVDAIGACIGPRRTRISKIVDELNGEKIDIIPYSEDDAEFIAKALAPAEVLNVVVNEDEETRSCTVTVPNNQLSLAIGNKGQNAKLAAKLTGYKIDIKPEQSITES